MKFPAHPLLQNQTALVLGLGESGLAMARWCARFGTQLRVWDSREAPPQAQVLAEELPSAGRLSGPLDAPGALTGVSLVLKSPGLSPQDERLSSLFEQARQAGIPVWGELELFAAALAGLKSDHGYAPKVVAITGTNGKTTTASMTALLMERAGLRVALAGNIGPTLLDTLSAALEQEPDRTPLAEQAEALEAQQAEPPAQLVEAQPEPAMAEPQPVAEPRDGEAESAAQIEQGAQVAPLSEAGSGSAVEAEADADARAEGGGPPPHLIPSPPPAPVFEQLPEAWVLELSSFQLDAVIGFEPGAATVLNISEDHLDWHGSLTAYSAAKARIFGNSAVMVVNRDDPAVLAMVPAPVPGKGRFAKPVERQVVSFGLGVPQRAGDFGLEVQNGMAWLVRANPADETIGLRRKRGAAAEPEPLFIQRLMPADALRVRGRHNAANALAALALASAVGCPLAPMLHGLREYGGEPHRVEFVAAVQGVEAYDDSKGTNVGATVAALQGLGADKAPGRLVLILGGDGKGQDFQPLAEPVRQHARAVATLGRDAAVIEAALADSGVTLQRHASLQEATRWAFAQAAASDAVLLSPACASLDMFRNYAHRAEVFVAEVRSLAAETGSEA